MATPPRPTRTPTSLVGLAAGAAVVAALVAFLAGRLTADAATSTIEARGARGGDHAPAQAAWASEPTRRAEAARAEPPHLQPLDLPRGEPAAVAPSAMAGVIPPPGQSSPAVAAASAQAAVETKQQLEALRSDLLQKCWPSAGLPKGRTSARLTFSVAYDAHGREVARGVSEDRRAPAGELRRCVSRQPLGTLRISPPGTSVSVKVALNLP